MLMRILISRLPARVKLPLRRMRDFIRALRYFGNERYCPVCEKSSSRFRPYGRTPRKDAQCIHCGALERHRFLWLFLRKKSDLFDGKRKRMLHVAPEACFKTRFEKWLKGDYITADLSDPRAMVKMDICDIQYPDESFDVIYCSHVLEHVEDDKKAMREFFRVLANGGWAILLVPIYGDKTFEDPSIKNPAERLKVFGQEDHVRRYGPDYADRLREAGFIVEITKVGDLFNRLEAERMGLAASGEIFYCTKA